MNHHDSRQIEILRVACITAMMWVHVSPGLSVETVVTAGEYSFIGTFLGNTLGRVSVSLLSFVSGFLLWHTAKDRPFRHVARRRFRAVVLPMLAWSAVFLALANAKPYLTGLPAHTLSDLAHDPLSLFNAWTGALDATANRSLFFLRDLFVATLIVRALVPLISGAPFVALALAVVVPLQDMLAPVIFRDSVLQFAAFGAVAARLGLSIRDLSRPSASIPLGVLFVTAGILASAWQGVPVAGELNLEILFRRLGTCLFVLAASDAFLRLFPHSQLVGLGRHAFLAYLIHVPLIGALAVLWRLEVGTSSDPSYVLFYVAAPFVVMATAVWAGRMLDVAPVPAQIAFRGKALRPAPPLAA